MRRLLQSRKTKNDKRSIRVRSGFPNERTEEGAVYVLPRECNFCDNRIKSSKYTLLNFLPKNLFEQFRRIANCYFLITGIIQLSIDSPVSPVASILPLVFVVSVSAVKQGYEDWLRHQADNEVNSQLVDILDDGNLVKVMAKDIKVGDIIRVCRNKGFPCDMVMISSDSVDGSCYVTTANLDGETNLQTFCAPTETKNFREIEELNKLNIYITCIPPVAEFHNFVGFLTYKENDNEMEIPLGSQNLLLRGARLRNTPYIYGCAVYTGQETKLALNSNFKSYKVSVVERKMNTFIKVFIAALIIEVSVCTGLNYWFDDKMGSYWYLHIEDELSVKKVVNDLLAFLVILNYTIPISLYVTIEVQKFIGSKFFAWDLSMYDAERELPAKTNTSDLNEELGQIEYLFTDKTGTLTQNSMVLQQCVIGGNCYVDFNGDLCEKPEVHDVKPVRIRCIKPEMQSFFEVLALCHTVRVDYIKMGQESFRRHYSLTGLEYHYQASSPDEKAFLDACRKYEVVYHGTRLSQARVSYNCRMKTYTILDCLDFDAVRKRMSVIIKDSDGEIYLLCKGAESSIMDRSVSPHKVYITQQITYYATLGLRTLVIANRHLTLEEYLDFKTKFNDAKKDLIERDKKLCDVYNEVENHLTLLGATGVEDKLQAAVPETIHSLRDAGIKIMVLTGDKVETAVNISYAAGHFRVGTFELHLTKMSNDNTIDINNCDILLTKYLALLNDTVMYDSKYAVVIDGPTLSILMEHYTDRLQELLLLCDTILCSRLIPIQKANIVNLIKTSKSRPVTAAIGDGANDVSMIQEADVGIGIFGKEGRQAVRYSDFAFSQFKSLLPAFLKHGHYYYLRVAYLVNYFFYKNIVFITCQIYYAYFNGFSQQSLFESFLLMFYNITFTSLPIFIYGLLEKDLNESDLIHNPTIYRKYTRNQLLSWSNFIKWNILGLWHSVVVFFGIFFLEDNFQSVLDGSETAGNWSFGFVIYMVCTVVVNLKLAIELYSWYTVTVLSFVITYVGSMSLLFIYSSFLWSQFLESNPMFMVIQRMLSSSSFWFAALILPFFALLPDVILRIIYDTTYLNKMRNSAANIYENKVAFSKSAGVLTISQTNILTE